MRIPSGIRNTNKKSSTLLPWIASCIARLPPDGRLYRMKLSGSRNNHKRHFFLSNNEDSVFNNRFRSQTDYGLNTPTMDYNFFNTQQHHYCNPTLKPIYVEECRKNDENWCFTKCAIELQSSLFNLKLSSALIYILIRYLFHSFAVNCN